MSFREDFPDYETYQDDSLYYTKVSPAVVAPLKDLILRIAGSAQHLKAICNDVASRVPCEPTRNVGWDWLVNDLDSMLEQVIRKKLYKFVDVICDLAGDHGNAEFAGELNHLFEACDFGYRMISADNGFGESYCRTVHKVPE
ncbi:MAG: hypothetical protein KGL31_00340 [candidate division NC10 bacterium]|nr:hypothetical protein [candidate division NC10 bacterium]MDE2320362.1 hypothetical protein [candidate division NC10 bacterium]